MAKARVDRVQLRHYRSIRSCDVPLGQLTFLVGPNGSGKSNFLDALRLVSEALRTSVDQALRERGGVNEVRRRSTGHPHNVRITLRLQLDDDAVEYGFEIGAARQGGFQIVRESCVVQPLAFGAEPQRFDVSDGVVTSTEPILPLPGRDRLYLVTAANLPMFRPVFDALSRMGFYNLHPEAIRDLQPPDSGDLLARDGHNLAGVLHRLAVDEPAVKRVVEEYLEAVVPGAVGVDRVSLGPRETLEFRQKVAGAPAPWRFPPQSISDGTLRALGVLVAIFQRPSAEVHPTLIGIEEPEVAVHPAAASVLREAIVEASRTRQIVVTSHSPELLDDPDLRPEQIVAVRAGDGVTVLGRPDPAGRTALRDRLYTAGELLRIDQLVPGSEPEQLSLEDGPTP